MHSKQTIPRLKPLEKIITPSALIMVDDNVVKTYTNPGSELNEESANENAEAVLDLIVDDMVFHLVVPDPTTLITLNPREYGNTEFEALKRAEAIVIKTLGHRMLANFYVRERINKYPIRIFDDENDAMAWFKEIELAQA